MGNRLIKLMSAKNAQEFPDFYDCEFLCPGLVSYKDIDRGICNLDKEVIDAMLPSILGKPVTINHQDVEPKTLERVANGYVIGAYFDPVTGKYRAKFIVTTDEARQKIADGWKVSCAYDVHELGPGGKRHAVPYQQNIMKGCFTHLAIVPPDKARYEESTIDAVNAGMMVFQNSTGEAHLFSDKPKQEVPPMLKFKFHFPLSIEKLENSVDPEKTFVEVAAGKKISVKELITAYNSVSTTKTEDVNEDSIMEIQNSVGETVKVSVKDLVAAYNATDEDEAKKKKLAEEEEKEVVNSMSDEDKEKYSKADDKEKANMRKNAMERKNASAMEEKDKKEKDARENAIKVAAQEEARIAAQKNLKTFTVVNSRGAIPGETAQVAGTKDDGRTSTGAARGKNYFAKKFGDKK